VQRAREFGEPCRVAFEIALFGAAQTFGESVQARVFLRKQRSRIARLQTRAQRGQTHHRAFDAATHAVGESCAQRKQAFVGARDARLRPLRVESCEKMIEMLRARFEQTCQQMRRARMLVRERAREVAQVGHEQFRGGRRRRRAQVGGEVGDREIDFVADRGDDGDRAGADRARDRFVVERPQVFERAAAPREQEHVVRFRARGRSEHGDDRGRRFLALHGHGNHVDACERKTPREHAEHVAHGRAAR
jgi:hypothetical protein